jgi:hypothetical protein
VHGVLLVAVYEPKMTIIPTARFSLRPADQLDQPLIAELNRRPALDKFGVGSKEECRGWDSNPHRSFLLRDFKSLASTNFATPASLESTDSQGHLLALHSRSSIAAYLSLDEMGAN